MNPWALRGTFVQLRKIPYASEGTCSLLTSAQRPTTNDHPVLAYLRLLRLPNVFSALADCLMGWFVAKLTWTWAESTPLEAVQLGLLLGASACLYLSGLVLNDVFDYEVDKVERPERPLPAGAIPLGTARQLGWTLLVAGVFCGVLAAWDSGQYYCAATAVVLALAVIGYNAGLKHTPVGPVVMGSCRWLNILLGMSAGPAPWPVWQLLLAAGIGVYIVGVTVFAKGEAGVSARGRLIAGWLIMLGGLALLWGVPRYAPEFPQIVAKVQSPDWTFLWLALAGLLSFRCVWAISDPGPQRVQQAITQCLRSLIILDALACYSVRDLDSALAVMALIVPQLLLGRLIYAT
jgi:4-hydroxybenzoate polyprenyltransferase